LEHILQCSKEKEQYSRIDITSIMKALLELTFSLVKEPAIFVGALTTKHFETTMKMLYN